MSAIDILLGNNTHHVAQFSPEHLPALPTMKVAIVACMDARMNIETLLGLGDGDAHILRNAGGIVTDDVIRSIMISQRILGTREVMIIHHTDCGMLKLTESEMNASLIEETGVRPPFAIGSFSDLDADVRQSISHIRTNPLVVHKDVVRGFVYEVETGRLREVS